MSEVLLHDNVAFLAGSESAVFFSKGSAAAGTSKATPEATALPIRRLQNVLDVAFWGEDNRFPQNIEQQMAFCGVGRAALDWKARALYGAGIIPGRIKDYQDNGTTEIFEPLSRSGADKAIYDFLERRSMFRFFLEYFQDWTWYSNAFPEVIFSKDGKTITDLVHQESNDSRYKQMDDNGKIETVFLSKLWGAAADQFAKFDPKKRMRGLYENPLNLTAVDNLFVKQRPCIDPYNAVQSARIIADKAAKSRSKAQQISAILPVNYPSPNKTYYQVAAWDGARLSGWVEIASKVPALLKHLYNKAYRIRYHIEIPESFFPRRYGVEKWKGMKQEEQVAARKKLLQEMDEYLTGDKAAFNSFISFFDFDPISKVEHGRIKITEIPNTSNIDKDLVTSSAADMQILTAMQVDPTMFGGGGVGSGQQRSGGSDKREAWLLYCARLALERQVVLEPLYLVRDFNAWDSDIVFRVRDTVLTTLDTGGGTEKKVS